MQTPTEKYVTYYNTYEYYQMITLKSKATAEVIN